MKPKKRTIKSENVPENLVRAVRLLNAMLELDPAAMRDIFNNEVKISKELEKSGLDFVCMAPDEGYERCTMGALGVIQGCIGFPLDKFRIARICQEDGSISSFGLLKVWGDKQPDGSVVRLKLKTDAP